MEDFRQYSIEEDDDWHVPDDERNYDTSPHEDGVPFCIPRD
ncbi:MAG: hypothetical protein ACXVJT_10600 [Thermoanaerobaculia bacterium]